MSTIWYFLLAGMLIAYAVLDGWDLGVGAIHRVVAHSDEERRLSLAAIGPLWNGNEVWLIAGGGVLFLAFPKVYASSFSGFYLALMLVLWSLMLRGVSLEVRSQITNPLWKEFWDTGFMVGSLLLALLLGVALGNLIGGLPVAPDGQFQGTFALLLNGHSIVVGLLSVVFLSLHGANYLAIKTEGSLHDRSQALAKPLSIIAVVLTIIATLICFAVRPGLLQNYTVWPILWIFPALAITSLIGILAGATRANDTLSFAASTALIISLGISVAISLYPILLFSTISPSLSLTVDNASSSPTALHSGLWTIGTALCITIAYQTWIFRQFLGKVSAKSMHY